MNENSDLNIDNCQRGMTLIELLVVILIAGILTGWGVSHWHLYQQALRLEHTAQQLLAFLIRLQDKEIGFYGVRNNAQAGHIVLSNGAGSLRLVLSAKGRLRVCSERKNARGIALCQL
ncbi:prepilin-type N-terminal cleavage/methylation domain-containing protein [Serratia symbiotica]|uniref:Putative Prepilin peptidase-dependent protein A n=1 Tax=Serratia symbiotica SCt-VLC TaxID=1347341 RepID=A0A068RBA8_9GAMM|nr:prepilin-type N-terminal cleavage/methylation domain-containing protein [Serratia symbiotica]CDG48273.1 Putative Prepilin peptidase-dependent protein A [Serratia symbiotica SCt-VLC]